MKVTEMMIGDWVHAKGIEITARVNVIQGASNAVCLENDGNMFWRLGEEIEPILLTEDILAKNFEKDNFGFVFVPKCRKDILSISWSEIFDKWTVAKNARGIMFNAQMKYVHELQHALRMCEVDKEIVLI